MRTILACTLLLAAPLAAQKIRVEPSAATLACGGEIPWRPSVEEALADAARLKRPVFWYVPTTSGSRMDRKPEIDHYMMAGPFSAPTVATLLERRFVPVKAVASGKLQKRYALAQLDFVEPGFLVVAPDGEEILRLDRLTTFNEEWFAWQLRRALRKRPDLAAAREVATARGAGDPWTVASALLEEGDAEGSAGVLPAAAADESAAARYLRARVAAARRDDEAAARLLAAVEEDAGAQAGTKAEAQVERGRLLLAQDDPAAALPCFRSGEAAGARRSEARFFEGVCLQLTARDDEAAQIWSVLARAKDADRWTRKAAAEAQRLGPFSRCFERFDRIPRAAFLEQPEGTRCPRTRADLDDVVWRSVRLLLRTQRASGAWDDSTYDFGGTDSLPNVYAAGTALAARALLEYPQVAGSAGERAVRRAFENLCDEKHLAWKDEDEIVWAHVFRLHLFEKLIADGHPLAGRAKKKAREIVGFLSRSQLKNGSWHHEYPNPFVTASVAVSLDGIRDVQVPIGSQMLKEAGAALLLCRGEDGTFSYGMVRRKRRGRSGGRVEGAAGRMPLCELALHCAGRSDQERLAHAIETSFEQHHLLERVRKVDDHADRWHNGGFFFWHDVLGRTQAICRLKDEEARRRLQARELDQILRIAEIDGGFVDSHELGKTYGTAVALICIKLLTDRNP